MPMKKCPKCKTEKPLSEFYERKKYRWECEKYQSYCKKCTLSRRKDWYESGGRKKVLDRANKWRKDNPDIAKQNHKKWNWTSKINALNAYGGKCTCCGEDEPVFLAIDHVNNDGANHRREISNKQTIYVWLKKNNYPTGFQVLCHNCNMAKAWGECPHKLNGNSKTSN